ncbi:MAG: co-chaperone GroES [Alphaproteobacteria bacterium]|nr:co-chaperone GroES [Alphaproteobacteria bacterium]
MKIKPLHDRVLVKRIDDMQKTAGGIIIPDTAKEKPSEGIVEAVGNGHRASDGKLEPMTVKSGDRVLFGKYAGTEIKVDGETRLIIREEDILAIVE